MFLSQVDCSAAVGYQAVYRLCLIVTLFFTLMSVIMINVKTSNDPRAGIQNGFWGFKYLIIIVSMIAAFWIPDGSFGDVWMYFGLVGGFLFILIQLVLIIDFAHSWAEAWYGNYQEDDSKGWLGALLSCTVLMFIGALFAMVLLFVYYTGQHAGQCKLHEFFVSFTKGSNLVWETSGGKAARVRWQFHWLRPSEGRCRSGWFGTLRSCSWPFSCPPPAYFHS